jgi:tetratricopeptide (TPR) repeat protein
MFCTTCGTKNAADSRFCKQCGHELDKTTTGRVREEDFDRALPEDEQINALLERAYRARKAGDNAQAIVLCQEALQLRPNSTTPHSLLGQIYESMGEHDLAIRAYERVLQLNPGSIADRVKLDELRGGILPALPGTSPPHIVFTQSRGRQGSTPLLSGVALGALMMLIGAAIALAWRSRSAPPLANSSLSNSPSTVGTDGPHKGVQRVADQTTVAQSSSNGGVSPASNATSATGTAPVYSPYPWSLPPTIIYAQPDRGQSVQVPTPVSNDRTPQANNNVAAVHLPGAKAGASGGRVQLPDDQTDDGKGNVVIQVSQQDRQKEGAKQTAPEPVNQGKISVTTGSRGTTPPDNTQSASFDSRSYIAAGDDFEVNNDYDKAIKAYSSALVSAGDERGSVYQHIAHSYQLKGDKTSAVANYRTAILEYKKLIDAGKMVEPAQEGINTCEKAIKTCNY